MNIIKIMHNCLFVWLLATLLLNFILPLSCKICYGLGIVIPDHFPTPKPIPIEPRIRPFQPPVVQSPILGIPLKIKKLIVNIEIKEIIAKTTVEQIFYNPTNRTIEGVYLYPIPHESAISDFAMEIDGNMVKGELLDISRANELYQNIVRKFQDPALLEFANERLFRIKIFPIDPYKERRIKLEYQQALNYDQNMVKISYPLRISGKLSEPIEEILLRLKIVSTKNISNVYSPTHKIEVKRLSNNEVLVSFNAKQFSSDSDLVIYYVFSDKELALSVMAHKPSDEEGTFLMLLSPNLKTNRESRSKPRVNLGLVIDTSGSMLGKKLEQAKAALEFCIQSIPEENYIYLLSFASDVNVFKDEPTLATSNIKAQAIEYIRNLEALGGTNINDALITAINALNKLDNGFPTYILFVTDGKPTVGVTNDEEIIKIVREKNNRNIKIFVLGVGNELNSLLLDSIANDNNGAIEYISESEDIEIKISSLYSKIINPILTNPEIYFEGILVSQLYPKKLPDIFSDSSISLCGLYKTGGKGKVKLVGNIEKEKVVYEYSVDFPLQSKENEFIPKIWAMRKIGSLLEQIRKYGYNEEIKNDIVSLSKRYGILTPYTAYLVLEDIEPRPPLPIITPMPPIPPAPPSPYDPYQTSKPFIIFRQNFTSEKINGKLELSKLKEVKEGAEAVSTSIDVKNLKSADIANIQYSLGPLNNREKSNINKTLGPTSFEQQFKSFAGKIFYYKNNKWIDISVSNDDKPTKIKAFSDAYFELVKRKPEIAKFLAIGNRLIIKLDKKVIEISPDEGIEKISDLDI